MWVVFTNFPIFRMADTKWASTAAIYFTPGPPPVLNLVAHALLFKVSDTYTEVLLT